jgi:cation transport ATPase
MSNNDFALAEKLTRRRARASIIFAVFFMLSHVGSFGADPASRPETFRLAAWIVWAVVLLLVLATGGGWLRPKSVRNLMNDDSTLDHRRSAQTFGFWMTAAIALALYAVSYFEPLSAREAIRLILTFSIGTALLRFGRLELRSLKNG